MTLLGGRHRLGTGDARVGGEADVHRRRGLERKLERTGRRLERRASCRSDGGGGGAGNGREASGAAAMARPAKMLHLRVSASIVCSPFGGILLLFEANEGVSPGTVSLPRGEAREALQNQPPTSF
jgi:hypothetical protein